MKFRYLLTTLLLLTFLCIVVITSCKKTEDAPPLPENRLLGFTVANTPDGPVQGVINDQEKTITVYLPYYTGLVSLLPEIKVPEGATVTPGSKVLLENWPQQQAMDKPMTYTVRSRNGNITTYRLLIDGQQQEPLAEEISADAGAPLVITHRQLQEGIFIFINGDNLVPNTKVTFITLVDASGKGFPLTTATNQPVSYQRFAAVIPADSAALPSGQYTVRVTSFSKTVRLNNPVIIRQMPKQ